jgi:hypothetical protein
MKTNFKIPEPCHEDWQSMSPQPQGRFCDKCCHVVVDFSAKTNSEISEYLRSKRGERVCGRVRREQLNKSGVSNFKSRYRIFFAALYFVFGGLLFTSCGNPSNDDVMGKIKQANSDTISKKNSLNKTSMNNSIGDTLHENDSLAKGQTAKRMRPVEPQIMDVGIISEDFFDHPDTTQNK